MDSKNQLKQRGLQRLDRARWLVFGVASILVFLVEAVNYFLLGRPFFEDIVNLFFGLVIAYVMSEFGYRYFSRLQGDLNDTADNLEAAEAKLYLQGAALESAANAIVITDRDGRITWVNHAFTNLTGYQAKEAIGQNPRLLRSGQHSPSFYQALWNTIQAGDVWVGEIINRRKDGRLYTEEQTITPVRNEAGEISHFVAIKQDITQRKQAEEAERKQRALAEALQIAGIALSASLEFDAIIDALLDQISHVVPFDTASVITVKNGRAYIKQIRGSEQFWEDLASALKNISFEVAATPNIHQVYATRQPLIIEDTTIYPGWISTELSAYMHSWIGIPVISYGEVIALLSLDKQEVGFYRPEHAQLLSAFAAQAALALHNASLFADKTDSLVREQRLNEMIQATSATLDLPSVLQLIVELAAKLVEARGAAMALISPDGNEIVYPYLYNLPDELEWRPAPKGKGVAWEIVETGQSIIISLYENHPQALSEWKAAGLHGFLGAPIVAGEAKLGALGLFSLSPENQFSERDRALAESIGRQAGIAIQNARLFAETRRHARELDLLNRIIATTSAAQNEAELFHISCVELARFFAVSQTVAVLIDKDRENIKIIAEYTALDLPSLIGMQVPIVNNPVLTRFFSAGEPHVMADVRQLPLPAEMEAALARRNIISVLMVPIFLRGKIVGALSIHSSEPRDFTEVEIHLAQTVGEELGQSLELARLNDRLRAYAAELETQVVERTKELAATNEQLQDLDRLKSKFVSDVSHELRTPITNLSMYLDLLEHGREERRTHYLGVLRKEVRRLHQLIEDILDLSRLETSWERGVHFTPVDLNQIVEQVVAAHKPRAEAAGLTLKFSPDPESSLLMGVQNQLIQVATNLLSNAINYTENGWVQVKLYRENGQMCLQVEDSGLGIGPADLPHLFDRFYRGQRVGQLKIPGTGLGLSIVKEIVDLHGGQVDVVSEPGAGSSFYVWLPLPETGPVIAGSETG